MSRTEEVHNRCALKAVRLCPTSALQQTVLYSASLQANCRAVTKAETVIFIATKTTRKKNSISTEPKKKSK